MSRSKVNRTKLVHGSSAVRSEYNDGLLRNNVRGDNRLTNDMKILERAQKVVLKDLGKESLMLRNKMQPSAGVPSRNPLTHTYYGTRIADPMSRSHHTSRENSTLRSPAKTKSKVKNSKSGIGSLKPLHPTLADKLKDMDMKTGSSLVLHDSQIPSVTNHTAQQNGEADSSRSGTSSSGVPSSDSVILQTHPHRPRTPELNPHKDEQQKHISGKAQQTPYRHRLSSTPSATAVINGKAPK